jgi:hypothetical protein
LIICPTVSGLFFGVIAALLVLRSASLGRATETGALVGGVMFASNAVALCIVHAAARNAPARPEASGARGGVEARAS